MLIAIALACLFLVCGYVFVHRRSRAYQCLAHLPCYPKLPLIGTAHYVIGSSRVITDLDDIKTITNEFLEKPYYYKFARVWLGDGILISSAAHWKRNIKKLAGMFNAKVVENFQSVFNSQAQILVENLKTEVGKGPFDANNKYLAKTTLETICQIALGVPKISDSIVTTEYYEAFMKTLEILSMRGFNLLLHSDLIFGLTRYKKQLEEAVDQLHDVSKTAMELRQQREYSTKSNGTHDSNSESTDNDFKSYLDVLLELNAKDPTFTMEQVRNEVDTIIFGGQETMATTLLYSLLMIGSYPDVQNKLHAEIKDIFGESNREVTKEDLARMTYCEAIINETLRLFPPFPGVFRQSDHELKLKSCTVPEGVTCVANILGVGRSKKYWGPDANKFRPERFKLGALPVMIPFSAGRRAYIGKKYAMSVLKTMVAYCVRELEFISDPDKIELKIDIILRPVYDKLMEVKLRVK